MRLKSSKAFAFSIYFLIALLHPNICFANSQNSPSAEPTSTQEVLKHKLQSMEQSIYLEPWKSYQELLSLLPENKVVDDEIKLWFIVRKALAENLLYFYQDFEKTIAEGKQLVTDESPMEIQSLLNLFQGMYLQRQSKYQEATSSFKQALSQAEKAKLTHVYIIAKQELAYTKSLTELFETSFLDLQQAYLEAFSINDQFLIAVINETYGAIYGYLHEYQKSIEYYQKALDSYQALGYVAHIAEAIYGLASTYRYWGKYELAAEKYRQYKTVISYSPNTDITFFGSYGLGMTLAEQGNCELAIIEIDQALSLDGVEDYKAELYKQKSNCLIQQNQLDLAEDNLNKAKDIFNGLPELHGTTWQIETIKFEGEIASARGQHEKANKLLRSYYDKYNEWLVENSTTRLLNARVSMELERNKVEKALAQQLSRVELLETESKAQQSKQNFYFTFWLICLAITLIVVISVQYKNNRKMHALSIIDSLSGLYNRRYIFNYLDDLLTDHVNEKSRLSVMLLDIDNFKLINDQYGHPLGDEVIKVIAEIGHHTLRNGDVMGRIGGEEFLCILPRTNIEQCEAIANRLIENIADYQHEQHKDLKVTVSIGISTLSVNATDCKSMYVNADKALYQAKKLGKNMACTFQESNKDS